MGLGSQNRLRRKEFQKEAGGAKWKDKIITIEDAQNLITKIMQRKMIDCYYIELKLKELSNFIIFKKENAGKFTVVHCNDCGSNVSSRPVDTMSLKLTKGFNCKKKGVCQKVM
jgi:predicted transcriptional regulator